MSELSTREALNAALPEAQRALAKLRSMSYGELKQVPGHAIKELTGFGRRVTLSTYMDVLTQHNSEIQIAVQLVSHGRFGFSRIWARGFRAFPQGGYRDLAEKELYEYS